MARMSQSEIRDAVNQMDNELVVVSSDPTNFVGRLTAAQKENAAWHRQHPTGGLAPKRTIAAMTVIRHREITIGRTLTEPERDAYLRQLCDASK